MVSGARALSIFLALAVAGATAFAIKALMDRRGAGDGAPGPAMEIVEVLIATRLLPAGTVITGEHVAYLAWPKAQVNPCYIVRSAKGKTNQAFKGYAVARGFHPGEPIGSDALYKPGRQKKSRGGGCVRPTTMLFHTPGALWGRASSSPPRFDDRLNDDWL